MTFDRIQDGDTAKDCAVRVLPSSEFKTLQEYQRGIQKFVSEGDKIWGLETEVPQRGPGQSPGGALGQSPQKLKIYMLKTIAIIC